MARNLLEDMNTAGIPDIQPKKNLLSEINKSEPQQPQQEGYFSRVVGEVGGAIKNIKENIERPLATARGGVDAFPQVTKELASGVIGSVGEIASHAWAPISQAIKPLFDLYSNALPEDFKKSAMEGQKALEELSNKYPNASRTIGGLLNTALGLAGIKGAKELSIPKSQTKVVKEALDLTAPVLNKQQKIATFEKAGKPGGVAQEGYFNRITRTPTAEDVKIAEVAFPYVNKSNGITKNISNLNNEIERFSSKDLRPFLQKNPRIFNVKTFESYLKSVEPPDWIKADSTALKTYDLVKQRMVDAVSKKPKTMEGLWDSRILFDNTVEQQFGEAIFDQTKRGFVNRAVRDMRKAVNDFIGEQIGDNTFKESMQRLNRLYEARGNIAEQKFNLLDKNFIQRYYKEHPGSAKIITRIAFGTGGVWTYFQLRDILGD